MLGTESNYHSCSGLGEALLPLYTLLSSVGVSRPNDMTVGVNSVNPNKHRGGQACHVGVRFAHPNLRGLNLGNLFIVLYLKPGLASCADHIVIGIALLWVGFFKLFQIAANLVRRQTGQTLFGREVSHHLVSGGRFQHRIDQLLTQLHDIFRRDFLKFGGVFHQQPP